MTVPEYICELLYRYNCVIIPEFGAFLTQRIPATLSKNEQLFYPPKKQVSFNQQIKNNDGLLANYIASSEQISYENSIFKIKKFVQEVTNELTNKGSVSFLEIGDFSLNTDNNIVFESKHTVNYLTESFGLATFKTAEIVRKENSSVSEEKALIASNSDSEPNKKGKFFLKYAAVGVLLLGLSGIALNSHQKSIDADNTQKFLAAESKVNNLVQSASFVLEVEEVLPAILVEVDTPKEVVTPKEKTHHIIAGAFRAYANAEKKMQQLVRKGFEPVYIGQNSYGLHQIAYESFDNENDAINSLNRLKRTENPAAWLLIKEN